MRERTARAGCWVILLVAAATSAWAEEVLKEIALERAPVGAEVDVRVPESVVRSWSAHDQVLTVESGEDGEARVPVLWLDHPGVTATRYALVGEVRHGELEGQGYLEMWSVFEDGARYFTRGLDAVGPMGVLSGSSEWRLFVLPFYLDEGSSTRPLALQLNVVLPRDGRAQLRRVRLVQFGPRENPMEIGSPGWWGQRGAGLLGAVGGVTMGLLGALVGILASSGKGRSLALAVLVGQVVGGFLCLGLGLVALVSRQPYAVTYPLLLLGGLATVIPGALLPTLRRRYEALELRRMEALDRG